MKRIDRFSPASKRSPYVGEIIRWEKKKVKWVITGKGFWVNQNLSVLSSLVVPSSIRGRCRTLFRQPRCRRLRLRCRRCPGPEEGFTGSRVGVLSGTAEQFRNRLWDLQNITVGESNGEQHPPHHHRLAGLSRANRARGRSLPVTTSLLDRAEAMVSSIVRRISLNRLLPIPFMRMSLKSFFNQDHKNFFSIKALIISLVDVAL